ncbi:MAG: PilZ domain-containing protein [Bacillota bacterium]
MVLRVEDVFKTGNTLQIQFNDATGRLRECSALIKTIIKGLKEDKLYLEFVEKETAKLIGKGAELTICFDIEEGEKRKFGTYVIEQKLREDQPLVLAKPVAVDYTSFRRYHRVDVELPFRYYLDDKHFDGKLTNLSGCGLFAVIEPNLRLKVDTVLNFEFTLPRNPRPTRLTGKIVRVEMVGNPVKQGIAVDFSEQIDKYDQVEIVVFVTKTQLAAK